MNFVVFALLWSLLHFSKSILSASANKHEEGDSVLRDDSHEDMFVESVNDDLMLNTLREMNLNVNHLNLTADFSALQKACRYGHTKSVDLLLKQEGIDINAGGEIYRIPLILACTYGHVEIIELLLAREDLDVIHCHKALHIATINNNPRILEMLLAKTRNSTNVHAERVYRSMALMSASAKGLLSIVSLLVAEDATDVNFSMPETDGNTAIFLASEEGHVEVVRALISSGKCEIYRQNIYGQVALSFATKEIVDLIDEYSTSNPEVLSDHEKASSNTEFIRKFFLLDYDIGRIEVFLREGGDINAKSFDGRTPLMTSCIDRRSEVVDLLLSQEGIDINAQDIFGKTALIFAVYDKEIVEKLLKRSEINLSSTENFGRNALMIACSTGQVETARMLLAKGGFDINAINFLGSTALEISAYCGESELVELILTYAESDPIIANKWRQITESNRSEVKNID